MKDYLVRPCKQCHVSTKLGMLKLPNRGPIYVCKDCGEKLKAEARLTYCLRYVEDNPGRPCALKPGHIGRCNAAGYRQVEITKEDKALDVAKKQGKLF